MLNLEKKYSFTHEGQTYGVRRLIDRDVSIPNNWGGAAGISRDAYNVFDRWAQQGSAPSTLKLGQRLLARDQQIDAMERQFVAKDGTQLPESGVGYRRAITTSRTSMTSLNSYDHRRHFRFDNSGVDARKNKVRRIEADVRGKASRYCCNVKTGTVAMELKGYETKRGWLGITIDLGCWMERWENELDDLLNEQAILEQLAEDILMRADCEGAFEGDTLTQLRGLKQANANRIYLKTPLDQEDYEGARNALELIANFNALKYGGSGSYRLSHMILPPSFGTVLNKERDVASHCCDDLGDKFDKWFAGKKYVQEGCSWLSDLGTNNTPAWVLYSRNSDAVYIDDAVRATWLPPIIEGGRMKRTCVLKRGEFILTDPSAMLIVSNVLTGRC